MNRPTRTIPCAEYPQEDQILASHIWFLAFENGCHASGPSGRNQAPTLDVRKTGLKITFAWNHMRGRGDVKWWRGAFHISPTTRHAPVLYSNYRQGSPLWTSFVNCNTLNVVINLIFAGFKLQAWLHNAFEKKKMDFKGDKVMPVASFSFIFTWGGGGGAVWNSCPTKR